MSVQKYETDVLQEHVDSTPILIERLEQWSRGVHVVQQYVHGYVQVHQSIAHNLEKTLKSIGETPSFPELPAGDTKDASSRNSSLATVFQNLQTNTNVLLQRSVATGNGIKTSILPQLDQIVTEIDKHYRTLRTQGGKGIKEIEKSREQTQRMIEQLGRVTSSFGSRTLSHHDDPYILHRRVQAAIADQVGRENTQAEAALNVQKSFASLEVHIMQTIRQSLTNLASLNDGYDNSEREINDAIAGLFKNVNLDREWAVFTKTNSQQLVPSTNFQRDPNRVTFVNKSHPSTQPLISGMLSRKTTLLKNWNQAFYAVVPSGYLHELKSADPQVEAAPELSLFLPECQLSKSTKPGEYVFKIFGKGTQKKIGGRHKYVFKTASARELEMWYNAIARITGNVAGDDDIDSPVDGEGDYLSSSPQTPNQSQPQSPTEPPTAAFANTSLDERATAPPAGAAAAAAAASPSGPSSPRAPGAAQSSVTPANSAAAAAYPSGPVSPRAPGSGTLTANSPAAGVVPESAAPQHATQAVRQESRPPPNYQPRSPDVPQQNAATHSYSPQQASTQQSYPQYNAQTTAAQPQGYYPSNTAAPSSSQQAGTVAHPWNQEVDEEQDSNRNSFLSANDPFKSF